MIYIMFQAFFSLSFAAVQQNKISSFIVPTENGNSEEQIFK
jgi:hypothetical protein